MSFDSHQICFGLNREQNERSFSLFLQLIGNRELADVLAKRLPDEEIDRFVADFTQLLRQHLTEDEYHLLFLQEESSPHTK